MCALTYILVSLLTLLRGLLAAIGICPLYSDIVEIKAEICCLGAVWSL